MKCPYLMEKSITVESSGENQSTVVKTLVVVVEDFRDCSKGECPYWDSCGGCKKIAKHLGDKYSI